MNLPAINRLSYKIEEIAILAIRHSVSRNGKNGKPIFNRFSELRNDAGIQHSQEKVVVEMLPR